MPRWLWVCAPLGLIGYALHFFGAPEVLLFVLSTLGIVPLAALIGKATEDLSYQVGVGAGGLLNATLGNVPELIIGILAVH